MLGVSREASQFLQSSYRAHRTGAMMEFSILPVVFSLRCQSLMRRFGIKLFKKGRFAAQILTA